eukprot:NODE_870_length_1728_cov_40.933294_g710_i0.p1 GENE.NODE_870_length_1728_cov_40.933294_g710_i0~~NODE_870_length_1728_cov_40.933294_g710_i0.p1  ORF type:complete len:249 (-),score=25.99 NODE_870_length_1728_cov_40.933294_g710_i0:158-904(-)
MVKVGAHTSHTRKPKASHGHHLARGHAGLRVPGPKCSAAKDQDKDVSNWSNKDGAGVCVKLAPSEWAGIDQKNYISFTPGTHANGYEWPEEGMKKVITLGDSKTGVFTDVKKGKPEYSCDYGAFEEGVILCPASGTTLKKVGSASNGGGGGGGGSNEPVQSPCRDDADFIVYVPIKSSTEGSVKCDGSVCPFPFGDRPGCTKQKVLETGAKGCTFSASCGGKDVSCEYAKSDRPNADYANGALSCTTS